MTQEQSAELEKIQLEVKRNNDTLKTEERGGLLVNEFKNGIKGVMYSRSYPRSGIKNIEEFSEFLKSELSKIYN